MPPRIPKLTAEERHERALAAAAQERLVDMAKDRAVAAARRLAAGGDSGLAATVLRQAEFEIIRHHVIASIGGIAYWEAVESEVNS